MINLTLQSEKCIYSCISQLGLYDRFEQTTEGVTVETPSATEIVLKGANKQKVCQIAANIRAVRPPEPYKGKGIRYDDEQVIRKEAKKK